jgi:hypothetical protein
MFSAVEWLLRYFNLIHYLQIINLLNLRDVFQIPPEELTMQTCSIDCSFAVANGVLPHLCRPYPLAAVVLPVDEKLLGGSGGAAVYASEVREEGGGAELVEEFGEGGGAAVGVAVGGDAPSSPKRLHPRLQRQLKEKLLNCWPHLSRGFKKHKRLLRNQDNYEAFREMLDHCHYSPTEGCFDILTNEMVKEMKKMDEEPFASWFESVYLHPTMRNWFIGASQIPGVLPNQNPHESLNKQFKSDAVVDHEKANLSNFVNRGIPAIMLYCEARLDSCTAPLVRDLWYLYCVSTSLCLFLINVLQVTSSGSTRRPCTTLRVVQKTSTRTFGPQSKNIPR